MTAADCPVLLSAVCQTAGSIGSTVVGSGASSVLNAMSTWVVEGANWLLGQIGSAMTATTSVDLGAAWFTSHYRVMVGIAAVAALPLLLLSIIESIYRQSAATLVRVVAVKVPLAFLLAAAATQLVALSLSVTDALCATVSTDAGADVQRALGGVAGALLVQGGGGPNTPPAFVVLFGALLVALGALFLWLEMLVRAAAVYVAVLFLPLGLVSLVWPAISHWCRRLTDTLVALVLAKFVIVSVLSLAAAALASGTQNGFASVLGGAAMLLLAAFAPFTLLRLVPAIESGAVHQLEGAHQRVRQAIGSAPRSIAAHALQAARSEQLLMGEPGTGERPDFGVPGADGVPGSPSGGSGVGAVPGPGGASGTGAPRGGGDGAVGYELDIPHWQGIPPDMGDPGAKPPRALPGEPFGPPTPLWGGPIEDPDDDAAGPYRAPMTIGRDSMGPVIVPRDRVLGESGGTESDGTDDA